MDDQIPIRTSLSELYPTDTLSTSKKRWENLVSRFRSEFGHKPTFVARSPGRVNIIGEHIDYSLYDALPAGVVADVIIAVASSPTESEQFTVAICNTNSEKFSSRKLEFEDKDSIDIDATKHEWTNYFKAGLKGALPLLSKTKPNFRPSNLEILVDGTVPTGGGLSSSAAFVCASALSVLYGNGIHSITKRSLTELAIVSERSVGVNSGGMDQSASVCSESGKALHVAFYPQLSVEPVSFPKTDPPLTFMIAQSFVASDKHVTGPVCYNLRVVEVTLAAEYIAAKLGLELPQDSSSLGRSLRGLQEAYFASNKTNKDFSSEFDRVSHMLSLVQEHLSDKNGYERQEIATTLGISISELEQRYTTTFPIRAERFFLNQRATHVYSEALRVHKFITLMKESSPSSSQESETLLKELGDLMNQSQISCREVYDCSCPELDEMCNIARKMGSYGSRLTGAGWGGCTVHLVPKDKVDDIRTAWIDEYYKVKKPDLSQEQQAEAVVVSEPGHGAMM